MSYSNYCLFGKTETLLFDIAKSTDITKGRVPSHAECTIVLLYLNQNDLINSYITVDVRVSIITMITWQHQF